VVVAAQQELVGRQYYKVVTAAQLQAQEEMSPYKVVDLYQGLEVPQHYQAAYQHQALAVQYL
jgi:hypothetical protein